MYIQEIFTGSIRQVWVETIDPDWMALCSVNAFCSFVPPAAQLNHLWMEKALQDDPHCSMARKTWHATSDMPGNHPPSSGTQSHRSWRYWGICPRAMNRTKGLFGRWNQDQKASYALIVLSGSYPRHGRVYISTRNHQRLREYWFLVDIHWKRDIKKRRECGTDLLDHFKTRCKACSGYIYRVVAAGQKGEEQLLFCSTKAL